MRLHLVRLRGYKRFSERVSLDTRGRLIAIIGPNESGKTSLLEAMEHLSSGESFETSEFTDWQPADSNDWLVSGHFSLETEDLEALGSLAPKEALAYRIFRYSDGTLRWRLDPDLHRDLAPRRKALKELKKALDRGWLDDVDLPEDALEEELTLIDLAREVTEFLASGEETLEKEELRLLGVLTEALAQSVGKKARKSLERLPATLGAALKAEEEQHPSYQAAAILDERRPRFLRFTDQDRDLDAEYVWAEHKKPPRSLANLLSLAQIDFVRLRQAIMNEDRVTVDDMILAANNRLDEIFRVWRQDELFVSLSADNEKLHILVRDRDMQTHTRFDERSAGLRSFVALIAFTARYAGDTRPILLIDEAEAHLHYGGQADLVRVFERQRVADTIIYTTHSIGCLPEDLGATIRVVAPTRRRRSTIKNSFWAGTGIGLTPMMLAMGAHALAFTPSRRVVIAEGPVEAILLPTLLREARPSTEHDEPLGYQVAPGVAEIRPEAAAELELEAGNVAYLVDSDTGGRAHTRKLAPRAKREERVLVLGEGKEAGLSTEDFVRAEVLAQAFNNVLGRLPNPLTDRLRPDDLPSVGRSSMLAEWCQQRDMEVPSKTQVAQEILAVAADSSRGIVDPKRRQQLRSLHRLLISATDPPSPTHGS